MATPEPPDLGPSIYQAIAARQLAQDTMLWQTPALSLTAEAFLFTIALSGGSSEGARLLASILAAIVSYLSVQLMEKHHYMAIVDAELLVKLEKDQPLALALGVEPHEELALLAPTVPKAQKHANIWTGMRSTRVWIGGLKLFGAAATAVFVITLISPTVFDSPTPSPTPHCVATSSTQCKP